MDAGINFSRIEDSDEISKRNKEFIKKFLTHMKTVEEVSDQRIRKYRTQLGQIGEWVDFDFDEATEDDIKDLVSRIKSMDYSKWSIHDFKVAIKKLYRELFGEGREHDKSCPSEASWICTYNGEDGGITLPEDLKVLTTTSYLYESKNCCFCCYIVSTFSYVSFCDA